MTRYPERQLLAVAVGTTVALTLATPAAIAGIAPPEPELDSVVDTEIETLADGFRYDYSITNTSEQVFITETPGTVSPALVVQPPPNTIPVIVDWELPFFDDAGISNIISPVGWSHAIEDVGMANPETGWGGIAGWQIPGDPFFEFINDTPLLTPSQKEAFLTAEQVLHWYIPPDFFVADCTGTVASNDADPDCSWGWEGLEIQGIPDRAVFPGGTQSGFSFEAPPFDAINAPYQASWAFFEIQTGDPPFPGQPGPGIPQSPSLQPQQMPLPGSLALLALGLSGLGWRLRRQD